MTRRDLLAASPALLAAGCSAGDGPQPAASVETAKTHQWHLRYAPRMSLLGDAYSVEQHLEIYADYGFRAFEYNGLPHNHSLQEAEGIRRKMDSLGMEMGVFVVNSGGWKGDALVDQVSRRLPRRTQGRRITSDPQPLGHGHHRSVGRLSVARRQTENVIEGLKRAAEIVEPTELTLVLEPLNVLVNHAGYHVVTSEHAARIIDGVGSSRVKILFDIYHQQISEGNLTANIEKHWDRIAYFQAGDVPGRKEPGTGEIRYEHLFRRLYEKGYEGIVGMEHGLSGEGLAGLEKCFEEYRKADTWS